MVGHPGVPPSVAAMFRDSFRGPLIASGGFTKASADAAIQAGIVDAIAFGRAFISGPAASDGYWRVPQCL